VRRPRLGLLGLGWIGRLRLQALATEPAIEIAALADPDPAAVEAAAGLAPDAMRLATLDDLLTVPLDGVVIATPSARHAEEATRALQAGLAVFCQKPLARTARETARVVDAARDADRLLEVDLSYRHTAALVELRRRIARGDIGRVFAVDLTFHNAYGPDKPWYYDPRASGGGCLMDLGTHLVDLVSWLSPGGTVHVESSSLFTQGQAWQPGSAMVEDYALAHLRLATGAVARLACSWNAPTGCDAVIGVEVTGTAGGMRMRNVNGSFYDFALEHLRGTSSEVIVEPPDAWGGRALVDWAQRLTRAATFDPQCEHLTAIAVTLDAIYACAVATLPTNDQEARDVGRVVS
jgi:predicted dehydrogenase